MSRELVANIESEYRRYRALGEKAMSQLSDHALNRIAATDGNSIAMVVRHLSGNLLSRFTDFLTTDGEKPWRNRDGEFETREYSRAETDQMWKDGWGVLERELASLTDDALRREVKIRQQSLTVQEALLRSLAHAAYHVGQMVLLARIFAHEEWKSLSIPKGKSEEYNRAPTLEKGLR
ncbi:MAG TPA: DUF1572 family protein [Gemmatimonadaceae bacterium]|nr:DUF1572 family protein [Gemmatimonadaceae bacterium]